MQPVFLCVDDTMLSTFDTKFENVSKLFNHAKGHLSFLPYDGILCQMLINPNCFFHPIIKSIHHPSPIKHRIRIMYNTMMIRAYNHLVIRLIIQTINKIIDMMCLCDM